uniref:Uncharacterized protein n=1 Tax=Rhizophora mucronata TaxID=61149 RepID=A0A2P2PLI3_RHIMU
MIAFLPIGQHLCMHSKTSTYPREEYQFITSLSLKKILQMQCARPQNIKIDVQENCQNSVAYK